MQVNVQGAGEFLDVTVSGRTEIRIQVSLPCKSDALGLMAEIFASGARTETCTSEAYL